MISRRSVVFCLEIEVGEALHHALSSIEDVVLISDVHALTSVETRTPSSDEGGPSHLILLDRMRFYDSLRLLLQRQDTYRAWLCIPSQSQWLELVSDSTAAPSAWSLFKAGLLKYLCDIVPRERWFVLNDARFDGHAAATAARLISGAAPAQVDDEAHGHEDEPAVQPPRMTPSELAGAYAIKFNHTYETKKGEPGQSLLGRGWSYAESSHVWSNSARSVIYLPLGPTHGETMLLCRLRGFHIGRPFELRIAVDGRSVTIRRYRQTGSKTIEILVPLSFGRLPSPARLAELTLDFSQTWSPREVYGNSSDDRRLAIALASIQVEEVSPHTRREAMDHACLFRGSGLVELMDILPPARPLAFAQGTGPGTGEVDPVLGRMSIVLVDLVEHAEYADIPDGLLQPGEMRTVLLIANDEGQRERAIHFAQTAAPTLAAGSLLFMGSEEDVLGALELGGQVPDILVVTTLRQAAGLQANIARRSASAASINLIVCLTDDVDELARLRSPFAGSAARLTVHDTCIVLRPREHIQ